MGGTGTQKGSEGVKDGDEGEGGAPPIKNETVMVQPAIAKEVVQEKDIPQRVPLLCIFRPSYCHLTACSWFK